MEEEVKYLYNGEWYTKAELKAQKKEYTNKRLLSLVAELFWMHICQCLAALMVPTIMWLIWYFCTDLDGLYLCGWWIIIGAWIMMAVWFTLSNAIKAYKFRQKKLIYKTASRKFSIYEF